MESKIVEIVIHFEQLFNKHNKYFKINPFCKTITSSKPTNYPHSCYVVFGIETFDKEDMEQVWAPGKRGFQ